ncbi:MAG TPA: hypothetical protein DF383_10475 [Deltaproteobacteria bacterium]|nr:hypothetical protein [Deltaproteobacteria bacterium]
MFDGNLEFFFEGPTYYAALDAAIQSAKRSIDLEMYIFAGDAVGRRIAVSLAKQAYAGVKVRVLYDSIGSQWTDTGLWSLLEENGVELQEYNPTFPWPKNLRRRNHRKVLVVDGQVGFLGGFNLMDVPWRDSGVRCGHPEVLADLTQLFELAWERRNLRLRKMARRHARRWRPGSPGIHAVPSYGLRRFSRIRQHYLAAIQLARRRIWITNPYFVPDLGLLRALRRAARKGVEVKILTAGLTDVRVARWASHAVYSRLLKSGVRIFEYQPQVLHAKHMVVDEAWFTLGTSNLDHLSFFQNLEVNLFGTDRSAAAVLAEQFEKDVVESLEINFTEWKKRSRWRKLREKFFYAFRAWM